MTDVEENKNYVTPYAFGVNESLLGKALASPTRRLSSIIIDFLVVGSLTLMSASFLAGCIFVVSIIGSFKARRKQTRESVDSYASSVLTVTALLSLLFMASNFFFSNADSESASPKPQKTVLESVVGFDSSDKRKTVDEDEKKSDLLAWAQSTITDFGVGLGWAALYFSVFTAWFNGQTVGKIIFRIKVVKIDGKEMSLWESFGRYGGYSAGLATGLMGFLQVIWDPNRQAIHDKVSETVVLDLRKPDRIG